MNVEEKVMRVYNGSPEDFHWAGFGSGSGTNLAKCAGVKKPSLIICDKPSAKLLGLPELEGVERIIENGYKLCGSFLAAQKSDEAMAEYKRKCSAFNELLLERIQEFEKQAGYKIDLIVLGGYMRFVMDPLLSAFSDRMINVHPADLTVLEDKPGKPGEKTRKYIGADAVYDAIAAGERMTRSSVIIVDEQEDHGEIICLGPEVTVWDEYLNARDHSEQEICRREYADAHQSFQKARSDWPSLTTALQLISEGRIGIGEKKAFHSEWRQVYLDSSEPDSVSPQWKPLGYGGHVLD